MNGIYLKSISGAHLIIDENSGPIHMNNETGKENIFDALKNGDKIEITYDLINEPYPAVTRIYSCKLLKKGNINDVPKDVLDKLQELGWKFDLSN